ncbi:MAG: hypothetical protein KBC81_02945 [Candidatus Pacebacteria bacterium]|nr:hypothetical protein [Candidatus Paceibacterota bacterium]
MNFIQKNITAVLVIVAVACAGSGYYFYHQYQTLKQNPQAVTDKENAALVAKLGQLIVLPTNEQPTIATVADPSKLKDQPFFASAKTGDRVFIYTNAKKAILYDETANKIIEVAPINIGK